jgi:hypothetical protein
MRRCVGWLLRDDLRMKWSWPNLRWNPDICLEKVWGRPHRPQQMFAGIWTSGLPDMTHECYRLYSPLGPWPLIFQFHDPLTDSRTPWTSDQLVAMPLHKHRSTQTQNKHTYQISMPCVGFEPTIPCFRASEDSTCLRPVGYRDRLLTSHPTIIFLSPNVNYRCYHPLC